MQQPRHHLRHNWRTAWSNNFTAKPRAILFKPIMHFSIDLVQLSHCVHPHKPCWNYRAPATASRSARCTRERSSRGVLFVRYLENAIAVHKVISAKVGASPPSSQSRPSDKCLSTKGLHPLFLAISSIRCTSDKFFWKFSPWKRGDWRR